MIRSTRTRRATLRQRSATTRAQARIARNGAATLKTHAIAAGLSPHEATSVSGSLRSAAKRLHIEGRAVRVHAKGRMRDARVYTPAEVAAAALTYRPRLAAYRTARAHLLLAA